MWRRAVAKPGLPHEGAPADAFEDFSLDRSATAATDRRPLGEALLAAVEEPHPEALQDQRHDCRLRLCGYPDDLIGKLHLEPATTSPANPDAPTPAQRGRSPVHEWCTDSNKQRPLVAHTDNDLMNRAMVQ